MPIDEVDPGLPDAEASVVRIVVMGVAGSGKTTIATRLADHLEARFLDADDAHPAANVAKMAAGQSLTDDDRWPWLARLRTELQVCDPIVITCSALRRTYRDVLRQAGGVQFVFLDVTADVAHERATRRTGHFMGPGMIASQFNTLERPDATETDVAIVAADDDAACVLAEVISAMERAADGGAPDQTPERRSM